MNDSFVRHSQPPFSLAGRPGNVVVVIASSLPDVGHPSMQPLSVSTTALPKKSMAKPGPPGPDTSPVWMRARLVDGLRSTMDRDVSLRTTPCESSSSTSASDALGSFGPDDTNGPVS